ncbi:SDR family NAD(P)-dependent oxidoreductase [Paenibacillus macquariensis]|uniref:Short chain dehydrogenase n=1 Tax=Paenibacillus macquariensis TaxID=948756 RepID=A0ABY1JU41_9BACL|nr:SDR family NAD(P)-dependent oxidoreductase [Paenibacillus macquariensis]MEC0091005.1 SDR family NAD(P)-dependent oxidoreductase [Paenibacillus macquariensis]OAB34724.1 short-chain dehydrogenase [Paenibacillus macquariensis subsp. macquariensis]SIQ78775.1 short chain dehydrogenase [Paenibacillus macquariensis]
MSKPLLVIVGAGNGVSAGVARKFGANGFRVVLVARNQQSLNQYTSELAEHNVEAYSITADASDCHSITNAFDQITQKFGTPEVLVYNAAAISQSDPLTLTETELQEDFKVNVSGALTSAQQVIPAFIEQNKGTLLFTGGGFAVAPSAKYTSLSIGKAGIRALAFALAEELNPHGIHVGTVTIAGNVSPGTFFDPDLIAERYWELHTNKDLTEIVYAQ